MVNCSYLTYEPSHCTACTGWFCNVFGKRKKLTDTSMCVNKEDWLICTRYTKVNPVKESEVEEEVIELPLTEEVITSTGVDMETSKVSVEPEPVPEPEPEPVQVWVPPPPPTSDCPYLGPVPVDAVACCGFWCHASNTAIRTTTACTSPPSWRECKKYVLGPNLGGK